MVSAAANLGLESVDGSAYENAALCLVDAIYSINLGYRSAVAKVVQRCRQAFAEEGVSDVQTLVHFIEARDTESITRTPFSAHRTAGRNNILKIDAVLREARVLLRHGVNDCAQICEHTEDSGLAYDFHSVPGQTDIALWYLFMLAGRDDYVKPDRRLWRYLTGTVGVSARTNRDVLVLMRSAASELGCTPRALDHALWLIA